MRFDAILVGGGLQNCLIAASVLARDPHARIALVERDPALGGNHTWSFHAGDLSSEMAAQIRPWVVHRWPAYEVAFPGLHRRIDRPYACLTSGSVHRELSSLFAAAPEARLYLGAAATSVAANEVLLANDTRLEAGLVIDARGPGTDFGAVAGFQKFVGLELELGAPGTSEIPTLMDASVEQLDGFRFLYALPFGPERVLLEDTYYSDTPDLDVVQIQARILAYAAEKKLKVRQVLRVEQGVLPLPRVLPPPSGFTPGSEVLHAGYAGGYFHPTTGYSLSCAAKLAELVARGWPRPPSAAAMQRFQAEHRRQATFFTLLNRLLFQACPPEHRWQLFARFHRLPEATVERFYSMEWSGLDRARLFFGRPPRGIRIKQTLSEFAAALR